MTFNIRQTIVALIAMAWHFGASAAMVTFEGVANAGTPEVFSVAPYTEAGYTISNSNGGDDTDGIFDSTSTRHQSNSDVFVWCGGCGPQQTILSQNAPGPFDLLSLELGGLDGFFANMTLSGTLLGGGSLTHTESNLDALRLVSLNWTSLTSFSIIITNGANGVLDNINVQPSAVPEPLSIALVGVGLLGMCAARRRSS